MFIRGNQSNYKESELFNLEKRDEDDDNSLTRTFDQRNQQQVNIFSQELRDEKSPQPTQGRGSSSDIALQSQQKHSQRKEERSGRRPRKKKESKNYSQNKDLVSYQNSQNEREGSQNSNSVPAGYKPLRAQNCKQIRSPVSRESQPPPKQPLDQHDQALIQQLRDQITFLEQQNEKLKEIQKQEQARVQDYSDKYDDVRSQARKTELTVEGQVRSLESQMRTQKIEKQDLTLKLVHANRRIRELEDKQIEMTQFKRKEEEFAEKLDQSHQAMRLEIEKNRDLQKQNEQLEKSFQVLEASLVQAKVDKVALEKENQMLKEFFEAKKSEADKDAYHRMLESQLHDHCREKADYRSRSQGQKSNQSNLSPKIDKESRDLSRPQNDETLAEKMLERSSDSRYQRKAVSQLSANDESSSLLCLQNMKAPVQQQSGTTPTAEYGHQLRKKEPGNSQRFAMQQESFSDHRRERDSKETGRFKGSTGSYQHDDEYEEGPMSQRIQYLMQQSHILREHHELKTQQSPLRVKSTGRSEHREIAQPQVLKSSRNDTSKISNDGLSTRFPRNSLLEELPEHRENFQPLRSKRSEHRDKAQLNERTSCCCSRANSQKQNIAQSSSQVLQDANYIQPFKTHDSNIPPDNTTSRSKVQTGRESHSPLRTKSQNSAAQGLNNHSPLRSKNNSVRRHSSISASRRPNISPNDYRRKQDTNETPGIQPMSLFASDTRVKKDFNANQIREQAGINLHKSLQNHQRTPSANNLRSKRDRSAPDHSYYSGERPSDLKNRESSYISQNRDYINKTREREESSGRRRSGSLMQPLVDREKLQEAYNQRLLNQIENLAAQAVKKNDTKPRLNKFMRAGEPDLESNKDDSISDRGVATRQLHNMSQQKQPLPRNIFSTAVDEPPRPNSAYQARPEQQLPQPRQLSTSDHSNNRNASNKSGPRKQKRTLSRDEDHEDILNMIVEPKRDSFGRQEPARKSSRVKADGPASNSIFARREALQSRLKNL